MDTVNESPLSPVGTVGAQLAEERRRQGKTVLEVEAGTKIMARMIEAIEHGRTDVLPSPAYVKGYIQSYAKFLGMPLEPLLAEYKREAGLGDGTQQLHLIDESAPIAANEQLHAVPTVPRSVWLVVAGVVVVVLLVVWIASALGNKKTTLLPIPRETTSTATSTTKSSNKTVAASDASATANASATSASTSSGATSGSFTLQVSVNAGSASWMKVTVDGLTAYEGTLSSGQTKSWTVTSSAKLTIGRPDAVTVTRDGTPVPVSNSSGLGKVDLSTSGN